MGQEAKNFRSLIHIEAGGQTPQEKRGFLIHTHTAVFRV
jgi:hypothetical protein